MKQFFSLIIIMCLVSACLVKETEVPILSSGDRIMIDGVFEVGQPWDIYIQRARTLSDFNTDDTAVISDATVNIYEGNNLLETLSPIGSGRYLGTTSSKENTEYTIEVISKNLGTATATTFTPGRKVIVPSAPIREAGRYSTTNEFYTLWSVGFSDPKEEQNYYTIRFRAFDEFEDLSLCWDSNDPFLAGLKEIDPFQGNEILPICGLVTFSDELITSGIARINAQLPENELAIKDTLLFELYSLSEVLFDYNKAIQTQDNQNQDEGILFGEPTTIPTNVENGVGIFAAFLRSEVKESL